MRRQNGQAETKRPLAARRPPRPGDPRDAGVSAERSPDAGEFPKLPAVAPRGRAEAVAAHPETGLQAAVRRGAQRGRKLPGAGQMGRLTHDGPACSGGAVGKRPQDGWPREPVAACVRPLEGLGGTHFKHGIASSTLWLISVASVSFGFGVKFAHSVALSEMA